MFLCTEEGWRQLQEACRAEMSFSTEAGGEGRIFYPAPSLTDLIAGFCHAQPRGKQRRPRAPGSPESALTLPLLVWLDRSRHQPVTRPAAVLVTLLWGERAGGDSCDRLISAASQNPSTAGKALCRETEVSGAGSFRAGKQGAASAGAVWGV